jgi:hypothetical protein
MVHRLQTPTAMHRWLFLLAACGTPPSPPGEVHADIATVACTDGWAVNYPKQHKLFEIAGQLWLFYSDGGSIVSTTSTDGIAWSTPNTIRTAEFGHRMGLWFDGTRLHYAFASAQSGGDVLYRRGTPAADGTITWDGPETVAFAMPADFNAMYPKVTVDAQGRPWIGFVLVKGGITTPPYDAVVTMSSSPDRWTTAPGFPFTLVFDHEETYPDPAGVALASGGVLWIYNRDDGSAPYVGRVFDGTWRDEAPVTQTSGTYGLYAVAADGDDVHLVYRGDGLRYRQRAPDGTWSSEVELDDSGSGHTSITLLGGGDVAVSWLDKGDDLVLFRERTSGHWGDTQLWADESAHALADKKNGINSNGLVAATSHWRGAVVYTTGTDVPFTLRFAGVPR